VVIDGYLKPLWIDDGSGKVRNPDISDAEFAAALSKQKDDNIAALWEAATKYQETWISGAAYGVVTLGVIQQKPKCLAVMMWISSIWNGLYYPRKAQVTEDFDSALYDFSSCGPMPYSVPELNAEVFGN